MNISDITVLPLRRSYMFLNAYIHVASQKQVRSPTDTMNTPYHNASLAKAENYSFLVVEDDEMILQSILEELHDRGYPARGLEDGTNIVTILDQLRPNVLLIDYYLAAKNGLQIAEELRTKLTHLTPILISAYPHVGRKARKQGIAFLEKPFSIDQVFAVLSQKKSKMAHGVQTTTVARMRKNTVPSALLDDLIQFFRADPP